MKQSIIAFLIVVVLGVGAYFFYQRSSEDIVVVNKTPSIETPSTPSVDVTQKNETPEKVVNKEETVIGKSVEGRDITAFHYGSGTKEVLFVGGIHGGYEWNTVLVAYELMDYLKANPNVVPDGVRVTVIPVLNPDGLNKTVGSPSRFTKADVPSPIEKTVSGRFNANTVDLNRNFDCDWQAKGVWNEVPVSGGSAAFSEPESKAFKAYVETHKLSGVVVWYSSAGGVFSSNCHNDVSPETAAITKIYADASGYPAHKVYNYYEITGDMANWLAKNNIPTISVLLTTHNDTEWSKNKAGIEALLTHYAK